MKHTYNLPAFVFLIYLLCAGNFLSAQSSGMSRLYASLQLHIDKQYFIPGETLFFSVYKVAEDTVADKSCVVSLVDEKGKLVESKQLLAGENAGSFFVMPNDEKARFYSVQCYSATQGRPVVNSYLIFSVLWTKPAPVAFSPAVKFYPESQQQYTDISPVIYFRMNNLPPEIFPLPYCITDAAGDTIVDAVSTREGAGRIELPAGSSSPYLFKCNISGSSFAREIESPAQTATAAVLNCYPVPGGLVYRIRSAAEDSFTLKLVSEGKLYYYSTVKLMPGDDFSKTLKLEQFKKGMNHIYLYNTSGRQLGHRPFFKPFANNSDSIKNIVSKNNQLRLELSRELKGNFSVSVAAVKKTGALLEENINEQDINVQSMDASYTEAAPAEPDSVMVTLTNLKNNSTFANENIKMFVRTPSRDWLEKSITDNEGRVGVSRLLLQDSATILFLPLEKKNDGTRLAGVAADYPVYIDTTFINEAVLSNNADAGAAVQIADALDRYRAKLLKEVVVKTKARSKMEILEETYVSPMYSSKANQVAALDLTSGYDNELMGNLSTFLLGKIPPVKNTPIASGTATDGYNYYINESLVDRSTANNIPLTDIAYISVMGRNFVPVTGEMGPAILIYTKKGNDRYASGSTEKNNLLRLKGFASNRKYFNPLFDDGAMSDALRTTVYWNSNLRIKNSNIVQLELNAPVKYPLLISIRGFDADGNFVMIDKTIVSE